MLLHYPIEAGLVDFDRLALFEGALIRAPRIIADHEQVEREFSLRFSRRARNDFDINAFFWWGGALTHHASPSSYSKRLYPCALAAFYAQDAPSLFLPHRSRATMTSKRHSRAWTCASFPASCAVPDV